MSSNGRPGLIHWTCSMSLQRLQLRRSQLRMRFLQQREEKKGRVPGDLIPRFSALIASILLHSAALIGIILLQHAAHPHLQVVQYDEVHLQTSPVYRTLNTGTGQGQGHPGHARRRSHLPRSVPAEATEIFDPGKPLHEQAQRWTSALTRSLNFHGVYLNHVYQLAVLQAGDIPLITPEELPPHFQQYVIVEVTIDTQGRAAEVRVVAGQVEPQIEQKLLAAVRKFRYAPATRDGLAIPSQRDIVIHVPTIG